MVDADIFAQLAVWALGDYIAPVAAVITGFGVVALLGAAILKVIQNERR